MSPTPLCTIWVIFNLILVTFFSSVFAEPENTSGEKPIVYRCVRPGHSSHGTLFCCDYKNPIGAKTAGAMHRCSVACRSPWGYCEVLSDSETNNYLTEACDKLLDELLLSEAFLACLRDDRLLKNAYDTIATSSQYFDSVIACAYTYNNKRKISSKMPHPIALFTVSDPNSSDYRKVYGGRDKSGNLVILVEADGSLVPDVYDEILLIWQDNFGNPLAGKALLDVAVEHERMHQTQLEYEGGPIDTPGKRRRFEQVGYNKSIEEIYKKLNEFGCE